MTRDELLELIPLYVLGHLEQDELRQVEALLKTDIDAQQQLHEYQALHETFVLSTPLRQAPAHLQDDLRRRLGAAAPSSAATQVTSKPTPAHIAAQQPTRITPRPTLPQETVPRRRAPLRALTGLAAVLAVTIVAIVLFRMAQDPYRLYEQITSQAGFARVPITALEDFGVGGELVISADRRSAVLALSNLPAITDAQTLQVWLAQANPELVVSGGLFRPMPGADGHTYLALPLDRSVDEYLRFSVSLEAAGGSQFPDKPTGPRILVVTL
jgi:anti-sigma-K factor RskA